MAFCNCPAAIRALVAAPTARRPSIVLGPVDRPPCSLQRPLGRALALQGAPVERAWAPHCFLDFMLGSYLQEFGGRNTHQGGLKIVPLHIASVFFVEIKSLRMPGIRSHTFPCVPTIPGTHGMGGDGYGYSVQSIHSQVIFSKERMKWGMDETDSLFISKQPHLVISPYCYGNG